jgi:hypothetical protein
MLLKDCFNNTPLCPNLGDNAGKSKKNAIDVFNTEGYVCMDASINFVKSCDDKHAKMNGDFGL